MKKPLSILAFGLSALAFAQGGDVAVMQGYPAGAPQGHQEAAPAFELISFVASPVDGEGVSLQWNTAAELPRTVFTVERSRDRMNWRPAFTQDAEGKAEGYNGYQVMDLEPIAGVSYYRLVASADGRKLEVSDDFAVEYVRQANLRIENDRIPGHFSMHGSGPITEVRILNNRGQFMPMELEYSGDAVYARGEGLVPGTYFVRALVDGKPLLREIQVMPTGVFGG